MRSSGARRRRSAQRSRPTCSAPRLQSSEARWEDACSRSSRMPTRSAWWCAPWVTTDCSRSRSSQAGGPPMHSASASGSAPAAGEVRGFVVAPREGEVTWEALRVDIGARGREDARGSRPARRPDRARRSSRVAAERPRALGRARRPGRDLRRPRGAAAPGRRAAALGRRARRLGPGGDGHPRRRARRGRASSRRTSRS